MMKRNILVTALGLNLVLSALAAAGPGHDHGKKTTKQQALPNCPIMDEPINLAVSTSTPEGPVFFCCPGCIKKYEENAPKYSKEVADQREALAKRPKIQTTCPVTGEPVDQDVSVDHGGEKVYFCCPGCASKFRKNPKKYASNLANSYTYQTICPIMQKTIDPTSFTKLADGRTIYYCCDGCEGKLFGKPVKYAKHLASQGYEYNWSKIKKAGETKGHGHDHHGGHGHDNHDH